MIYRFLPNVKFDCCRSHLVTLLVDVFPGIVFKPCLSLLCSQSLHILELCNFPLSVKKMGAPVPSPSLPPGDIPHGLGSHGMFVRSDPGCHLCLPLAPSLSLPFILPKEP